MITAHEVAVAIVTSAREVGADPIDVAQGVEDGASVARMQSTSRARAYAGRALDKVFNRPEVTVARPEIARMVGANKPSWGSFFSSLDGRPIPWWDEDVLKRVVEAVMDADPPEDVPRPVPSVPPSSPSQAKPITPKPVARQAPEPMLAADKPTGPLRQRMDRLADGVSRAPRSPFNPNMDWLTEKAIDRGRSRDLLAEAAANTRKLQDAMPPEPEAD